LQVAGDISKYQTLLDPKDTSIAQPPSNVNLGKRGRGVGNVGAPAKLPFIKERVDEVAKNNDEKVKESKALKEFKNRGRKRFEGDNDSDDEYSSNEIEEELDEDKSYEEDEEESSYKERHRANKRQKLNEVGKSKLLKRNSAI